MLAYFGYGTNRDHDMMAAMIGRENIEDVEAFLLGYELVIQGLQDISNVVLSTAPVPRSPQEIMRSALGEDAKLYIIRPNPKAVTYGRVWYMSEQEYEMVRDWELLDFGMQEDMQLVVQTPNGNHLQVQTHGSSDPKLPAEKVVVGAQYEDYLVPRESILNTAQRVHKEFLDRQKSVKLTS